MLSSSVKQLFNIKSNHDQFVTAQILRKRKLPMVEAYIYFHALLILVTMGRGSPFKPLC